MVFTIILNDGTKFSYSADSAIDALNKCKQEFPSFVVMSVIYDEELNRSNENAKELLRRLRNQWDNNDIQFPRLIAEIFAVGLTNEQMEQLCASMDLTVDDIDELFHRAESEYDNIKELYGKKY